MATKHTLILSEKVQLIRENEENASYRTLAEKYKISIGSVSNIIKCKAEYIES
jgi:Mor family transcriptional regulator